MNILKLLTSSASSNILIGLVLILALLYSFSGIFFGLDFTDSFYHLNQALNPADGIYLYPFFLSSVIIKGFIELAGSDIIYLRIINWFLLVTSMILPFIFIKVKCKRRVIILYFVFTLILYAPFNANILGYDTLSIFINSLLFSLTALYLKNRKNYLLIFLAMVGAMAIMVRLPNILVVPVIFVFILVAERFNRRKWELKSFLKPGIFLISTFFITAASFAFYYNSWEQFFAASSNAESHNFLSLIFKYSRDATKIVGYVILLLLGLFAYYKTSKKKFNPFINGLLMAFFLIILYFLVGVSKYSANYSYFLVAIALSLITGQIANNKGGKFSFQYLILYLFLFFMFINPMGSNTGLLKAYSLSLLFPFVLSLHELKYKKYWLMLFIILIPFSMITKIFGVYEDKMILTLNNKLEIEELTPIYTNFTRKEYLQQTDVLVHQLNSQGVEVFFYGDKSHIFHYLYPETALNISSFFQPVDNLSFYKEFSEYVNTKDRVAVFILNSYPESLQSELTFFEKHLEKDGFEQMDEGSLKYFLKVEK